MWCLLKHSSLRPNWVPSYEVTITHIQSQLQGLKMLFAIFSDYFWCAGILEEKEDIEKKEFLYKKRKSEKYDCLVNKNKN